MKLDFLIQFHSQSSENGIELKNPISSNGCFKDDVKHFGGLHVRKSEEEIIKKLKDADSLLCNEDFQHSYPHCWRHKTPLIFMATPQWFISMTKSGLLEGAPSNSPDLVIEINH